MKMTNLFSALMLFFLLIGNTVNAQESYDVKNLDSLLLKDANSVVILEENHASFIHNVFEFKRKRVITILNQEGLNALMNKTDVYNNKYEIKTFLGAIYDKNGNLFKGFNKVSLPLGENRRFVEKTSFTSIFQKEITSFPVTIAYKYIVEGKGIKSINDWFLCDDQQSIVDATYSIVYAQDDQVQDENFNNSFNPKIKHFDNNTTKIWRVENQLSAVHENEDNPRIKFGKPRIPKRYAFNY